MNANPDAPGGFAAPIGSARTWNSERAIQCLRAAYFASWTPLPHKKRHLSIYYANISKPQFIRAIRPLSKRIVDPMFSSYPAGLIRTMVAFCEGKYDEFHFEWDSSEFNVYADDPHPYEKISIDVRVKSTGAPNDQAEAQPPGNAPKPKPETL